MWADYCTIGLYLCFLILQTRLSLLAFWDQYIRLKKKKHCLSAPQNKPNKITAKYNCEAVFWSLRWNHLNQVSNGPELYGWP